MDEAIGYRTATRFWGYYVVERFLSITHFSVLLEPADDTKQVLETRKHERVSATDVTTVQTRQIEDKNIYPHTNKGEKKSCVALIHEDQPELSRQLHSRLCTLTTLGNDFGTSKIPKL